MIYEKLLRFQKLNVTIERDSTNPHYRSSYSSLNEVLSKVKPVLNEMGVVIVQSVEADGLRTRLVDTEKGGALVVTNDSIECFVPFVGATDMQKLGGAITYARRYSLVSLLGLEDEDLDGENTLPFIKGKAKKDDIDFGE